MNGTKDQMIQWIADFTAAPRRGDARYAEWSADRHRGSARHYEVMATDHGGGIATDLIVLAATPRATAERKRAAADDGGQPASFGSAA